MSDNHIVTRFAPSPTGHLHLGHAFSAILNHDRARGTGGRFLLRIEDIDNTRCSPAYEQAIYDGLSWLGLAWETPVRRQSDRLSVYESVLHDLHARGLVYRCFKTRKDIQDSMNAPHGPAPHGLADAAYTGAPLQADEERDKIAHGQSYAWRLSCRAARDALGPAFDTLTWREETHDGALAERPANPAQYGDIVLGRKDIGTSYHLSCVIDDADQGVTHVMRGEDLRDIAGLHALLCRLLGFAAPVYHHHALVTDASGKRLAKRDRAATLRHLRDSGLPPGDIRARLAPLLENAALALPHACH